MLIMSVVPIPVFLQNEEKTSFWGWFSKTREKSPFPLFLFPRHRLHAHCHLQLSHTQLPTSRLFHSNPPNKHCLFHFEFRMGHYPRSQTYWHYLFSTVSSPNSTRDGTWGLSSLASAYQPGLISCLLFSAPALSKAKRKTPPELWFSTSPPWSFCTSPANFISTNATPDAHSQS